MARHVHRTHRRAFSLIEILITMAIIVALAGVLLAALSKAKQTAKNLVGDVHVPTEHLVLFTAMQGEEIQANRGWGTARYVNDEELDRPVMEFDGSFILGLTMPELQDRVTIMFWAKGDAILPQATSLFYAYNSGGGRVLNLHFWSDRRAYFDAGANYDRVNTSPLADDLLKGKWVLWTLTKDAVKGEMKVYANGELLASATGKVKPMGGGTCLWVGGYPTFDADGRWTGQWPWRGRLHSFAVYDTVLDDELIAQFKDANFGKVQTYTNSVVDRVNAVDRDTDPFR